MKKALIIFVSFLFFAQPALADDITEVDVFLKGKLDHVMKILQDKSLEKKERNDKIIEVIDGAFDFSTMAKLTLGKKYWPGMTGADRDRFTKLFVERLKASYLEKLDLYDNEKIIYRKPVQVKKKVRMMTELVSGDNKITMLYKLYKLKKAGWRVYDLELEGVSLITTYRSQFNEVLQNGTMNDLFAKLERPEGL